MFNYSVLFIGEELFYYFKAVDSPCVVKTKSVKMKIAQDH